MKVNGRRDRVCSDGATKKTFSEVIPSILCSSSFLALDEPSTFLTASNHIIPTKSHAYLPPRPWTALSNLYLYLACVCDCANTRQQTP